MIGEVEGEEKTSMPLDPRIGCGDLHIGFR
jgi:hypothetical protein